MTQTFFSVDVETTSTNPFDGQLLTVGIVPINADTLEVGDGVHVSLKYDSEGSIDANTLAWWQNQNQDVYEVAWEHKKDRVSAKNAADFITGYVTSFSPDIKDRIFCANPVSFDYPWILKLFAEAKMEFPFHHRTLCMRSVYFGITGGVWGESRTPGNWYYPEQPHHALSDAHAQALDFVKMYVMTHENFRNETDLIGVGDVYD